MLPIYFLIICILFVSMAEPMEEIPEEVGDVSTRSSRKNTWKCPSWSPDQLWCYRENHISSRPLSGIVSIMPFSSFFSDGYGHLLNLFCFAGELRVARIRSFSRGGQLFLLRHTWRPRIHGTYGAYWVSSLRRDHQIDDWLPGSSFFHSCLVGVVLGHDQHFPLPMGWNDYHALWLCYAHRPDFHRATCGDWLFSEH